MLRRSLILIVAFVLLGLTLTMGFAMLMRGPDDVLTEAQAHFDRGDAAAAVRVLDLCEPGAGMKDNPELLRRLWRLRYDSHRVIDNPRRALEDIERLLRLEPDDLQLQLFRTYYLIREGQAEVARQHALATIQKRPDSARAHELAGEACQETYRVRLAELRRQLSVDLGRIREAEGLAAFHEFVFRQDGDREGPAALVRLQGLYESEPRFKTAWPKLLEELRTLRERVQEAWSHYQRSLELAPTSDPNNYYIMAYRGSAFALRQAGRPDDVVAQAEIWLSTHDHLYSNEAAVDVMRVYLRAGMDEAAVAFADRFLPDRTWNDRVAAGKLNKSVVPVINQLLTQKVMALWHLRDKDGLSRAGSDTNDMVVKGGLAVYVPPPTAFTMVSVLNNQGALNEQHLGAAIRLLQQQPPPPEDEDDPLDELVPLRLDMLRGTKTAPGTLVDAATQWQQARPASVAAMTAKARQQLATGQSAAALKTATELQLLAVHDEDALALLGEAAEHTYRNSSQDGESLLVQCLQRNIATPEAPPHPICLLLCGEAALRQHRPDIARACARAAADAFPSSRWPRLLEARAEFAAGAFAPGLAVLARTLTVSPRDQQALRLWFETSQRLELDTRPFLAHAVSTLPDNPAVTMALLQTALESNAPGLDRLAKAAAARSDASSDALALAGRALARTGDVDGAAATLQRANTAKAAGSTTGLLLLLADIELLVARRQALPDTELATAGRELLRRPAVAGPTAAKALLDASRQLAASDRPQTAWMLVNAALALGDAIEWRDADTFALAASCAQRLSLLDLAADHWTAALSFPDGNLTAEPLARLELARGNRDRARAAAAMAEPLTDAALALWLQQPNAAELAQQRARADRSDLLAAIPFALSHQVDAGTSAAELRTLPPASQRAALELAVILAEPTLGASAAARATALATDHPASPTLALLAARAAILDGRAEAGQTIHARLFAAGCRLPILFGEASWATTRPGYAMPPELLAELRLRAGAAPDSLPPTVLARTFRGVADEARRQGDHALATRILADLCRLLPEATKATIADAETLLQSGQLLTAATLFEHLRRSTVTADRLAAGAALYRAAIAHGAALPATFAEQLQRRAIDDLDRGELAAPAMQFLLADQGRCADLPLPAVRRYVAALLAAIGSGAGEASTVGPAMALAEARLGATIALELVDTAIAAAPTVARFWIERARLMVSQRRERLGIADARAALGYLADDDALLDFVILAAQHRALVAADRERLEQLPAELLATPRGRLARGLVAWRRGQGEAAETLLATVPPDATGFVLHARAQANLMRATKESRQLARELFARLCADYASSSLARSAGSFAAQLPPN